MGTVTRPELSEKNPYWISRHRYYELKHFCLQYSEWKENYISIDGMPSKSGSIAEYVDGGKIANITAVIAETRLYYRDRMEMVENAAMKAGDDLGKLLLKAVTEGLSYETVSPPCCKEVWYVIYRRFFWILDKARK